MGAGLAAAGAGLAVAGGIIGARGATEAGNAAYKQGQIQYGQELQRSHYEAKVLQRQMLEQLHTQMAQWGGSGASVGVGSPVTNMMKTINDLEEDKTHILREGQKKAWLLWQAGSDKQLASQYQATTSLLSGASSAMGAYSAGMAVKT